MAFRIRSWDSYHKGIYPQIFCRLALKKFAILFHMKPLWCNAFLIRLLPAGLQLHKERARSGWLFLGWCEFKHILAVNRLNQDNSLAYHTEFSEAASRGVLKNHKIAKFLRTTFSQKTSGWLLLKSQETTSHYALKYN